ncbi:hypothetical protein M3J09_011717 [Ascochyta lentis]
MVDEFMLSTWQVPETGSWMSKACLEQSPRSCNGNTPCGPNGPCTRSLASERASERGGATMDAVVDCVSLWTRRLDTPADEAPSYRTPLR